MFFSDLLHSVWLYDQSLGLVSRTQRFLSFFLSFFKFNFIYLFWLHWVFVVARGLFSSCGEQGLLFVVVRGLLIVVASLVAEHGL